MLADLLRKNWMKRAIMLFILLLAASGAFAQQYECREPNARPFRLRVLSVAGSEAQIKDVLILQGACRYIWHGDEGTYTPSYNENTDTASITFTPDDTNADPPWGGSAIVKENGRLCFPLGDDQCVLVGPKESWWRNLCPMQPFC